MLRCRMRPPRWYFLLAKKAPLPLDEADPCFRQNRRKMLGFAAHPAKTPRPADALRNAMLLLVYAWCLHLYALYIFR